MVEIDGDLASRLQALVDKDDIRNTMYVYARGVDRCDRALLETVFWPDSHVQVGLSFSGTGPELVDWALGGLGQLDQTMHMLGNMLIDLRGATAHVETYAHCYHRVPRADSTPFDVVMALRYVDRFEKRKGEWRVAERIMPNDWGRIYSDSCDWEQGFFGQPMIRNNNAGGRFPDDPSYRLFASRSAS